MPNIDTMKDIKTISSEIYKTLKDWGYNNGDMIRPMDMRHAIIISSAPSTTMYEAYTTCMCWSGVVTDFGDGLFMLNGGVL